MRMTPKTEKPLVQIRGFSVFYTWVLTGHPGFAGVRALAAGFCAFLTVVMVMFATLFCAQTANFDALFHHVLGMGRVAGNEARGKSTDVSAISVEHNAAYHHFDVVFLQTSGGAGLTGSNTFDEHML